MIRLGKQISSLVLVTVLVCGTSVQSFADQSGDMDAEYVDDPRSSSESSSRSEEFSKPKSFESYDKDAWLDEETPITAAQVKLWDNCLNDSKKTLVLEQDWDPSFYEEGEGISLVSPGYLFYMERFGKDVELNFTSTEMVQTEVDWNKPEYAPKDVNLKLLTSADLKALEEAQEFVGDLFDVKAFVTSTQRVLNHSYEFKYKDIKSYTSIDPNILVRTKTLHADRFAENYTVCIELGELNAYPAPHTVTVRVDGFGLGPLVDVYEYDSVEDQYIQWETQKPLKQGYIQLSMGTDPVTEFVLVGARREDLRVQDFYKYTAKGG